MLISVCLPTYYVEMVSIYDDVELLDMDYNAEQESFKYPCPCGDQFFITVCYFVLFVLQQTSQTYQSFDKVEDLMDNEDVAGCPSCSLLLRVNISNMKDFQQVIDKGRPFGDFASMCGKKKEKSSQQKHIMFATRQNLITNRFLQNRI